jgi:glutamate 5-kinase
MARHVIKLGSGIVANDDGSVRADVLAGICEEVAARRRAGDDVVMVSSGAIARGFNIMGLGGRPGAIEDLQAASAVGQGRLFRFYDELLADRGVTAAQVLLTFFDLSHRTHYLNARRTLRRLLEWGVVPVINENDTTATDEISFGDNDFLAAQVAILVEADRLVLLTGVDGVYTADPRTDPAAELVGEITNFEALDDQASIGASTSKLGSGGMRSKVVAAEMATAAALREGGTSLLPVGVTEVHGDFAAGDAVEVRSPDGLLGKGIANYGAPELRSVMGLQSARVREVLPRAAEEAVHRDYFVLA